MTTETRRFDVLVSQGEGGGLRKIATAFPTNKGTGHRFTLKAALPEGARLVILPSRVTAKQDDPDVTVEMFTSLGYEPVALVSHKKA